MGSFPRFPLHSPLLCSTAVVIVFLSLASNVLLSRASFEPGPQPAIVTTQFGQIRGTIQDNFRAFKGIPFGQAGRWENPQPATPWAPATLNATQFGPICPQDSSGSQSENCLSINVWTPVNISQPLPVLLWIYGGAFVEGAGSFGVFNGNFFANSTNTIVVSFNYRVGALGFFSLNGTNISGNYGIRDQQLAMKWVKQNIQDFGGDTSNVTLFGESAGAMSVFYHLTLSSSAGLFDRALMESNPAGIMLRTQEENLGFEKTFLFLIGCHNNTIQCLHSKTFSQIVAAQPNTVDAQGVWILRDPRFILAWTPIIDGILFTEQPMDRLLQGQVNKVPTALGTVKNETVGWLFGQPLQHLPVNWGDYNTFIETELPVLAPQILKMYPPPKIGSTPLAFRLSLTRLVTDYLFICSTRLIARQLSNLSVPVYQYFFLHSPWNDPENNNIRECNNDTGACHASELPYVFHTFKQAGSVTRGNETQLSWSMLNYWASFAHQFQTSPVYGDPEWPLYTTSTDMSLAFDLPSPYVVQGHLQAQCDMWESFPLYFNFNATYR